MNATGHQSMLSLFLNLGGTLDTSNNGLLGMPNQELPEGESFLSILEGLQSSAAIVNPQRQNTSSDNGQLLPIEVSDQSKLVENKIEPSQNSPVISNQNQSTFEP